MRSRSPRRRFLLSSSSVLTQGRARCTTAAPGYIRPKDIPRLKSTFQDGGLKFNNPVKLARWEAFRIWGSSVEPDVVVSLGTGCQDVSATPKSPGFGNILRDGWIPRLVRAFLSSLDGQLTWKELWNSLDDTSRNDHFRLNVFPEGRLPSLDDTDRMEELRELADRRITNFPDVVDVTFALLASSFFFSLTAYPQYSAGFYTCHGTIHCDVIDNESVVESLERMFPSGLHFVVEANNSLGRMTRSQICSTCRTFQKRVVFAVRDIQDPVSMTIQSTNGKARNIIGKSKSMSWFIERQGLRSPFGTEDHGADAKSICQACNVFPCSPSKNRKRKLEESALRRGKRGCP